MLPELREAPIYVYHYSGGYDGVAYAQLALTDLAAFALLAVALWQAERQRENRAVGLLGAAGLAARGQPGGFQRRARFVADPARCAQGGRGPDRPRRLCGPH